MQCLQEYCCCEVEFFYTKIQNTRNFSWFQCNQAISPLKRHACTHIKHQPDAFLKQAEVNICGRKYIHQSHLSWGTCKRRKTSIDTSLGPAFPDLAHVHTVKVPTDECQEFRSVVRALQRPYELKCGNTQGFSEADPCIEKIVVSVFPAFLSKRAL